MVSAPLVGKNICIARLRSKVQYKEPLNHIVDSQCYLLKKFIEKHPEHSYSYYNITFDGSKPKKDIEAIKKADTIVIPSEAEWTYHIPGYIHTLDLKRSNEELAAIEPFLNNKKLIFLRSDRADNEELYHKTFPNIDFEYAEIDECDFEPNIHGLKYYFIKDYMMTQLEPNFEKIYDFIYWGGDKKKLPGGAKSQDIRHLVLKQIKTNTPTKKPKPTVESLEFGQTCPMGEKEEQPLQQLSSFWIGRFSNFKRDLKFMKMKELIPYLEKGKYTLCFNWMDNKATTSRYVEAIACGIIPLVWGNYDSDNHYGIEDWQRVNSYEEINRKICSFDLGYFRKVEKNFLDKLPPKKYYEETFEKKLLARI